MPGLNQTPNASRLHIGIYGKRNSGKSSLINALTNQNAALVSEVAGTTTDPVYKAMEIPGVGPCVFIDTAGFDDVSELGKLRVDQTRNTLKKTDIAIMLFSDFDFTLEREWLKALKTQKTPVLAVISKSDESPEKAYELLKIISTELKLSPITVSSVTRSGIDKLLQKLARSMPIEDDSASITGHLVNENDVVMLVMPQDIEAPKGRLILPQVQTTRDLLDKQCVIISCTPETMDKALSSLASPPALIITDSQVFSVVAAKKPPESKLTSFSILMAGVKGDVKEFITGANAVDTLTKNSHVLIAEACTHAPLTEDIGRVKIPALLKKRFGESLAITVVSGVNFPQDLSGFDLIVHCGGCMFNRKFLMSRISQANAENVPITNYGILLAKLNGILDKVVY